MGLLDALGARWYGTPCETASGRFIIAGDLAGICLPVTVPPTPLPCPPTKNHQVYSTGIGLGPLTVNQRVNDLCGAVSGEVVLNGYAWLHQLLSGGTVFRTGQEKDAKFFTMLGAPCPSPPSSVYWRAGVDSGVHRIEGNSVQLLTFEGTPPVRKERIDLVGGENAFGMNDTCGAGTQNTIERMVDPDQTKAWQLLTDPEAMMAFNRRHGNTVLLPDGTYVAIWTVGW